MVLIKRTPGKENSQCIFECPSCFVVVVEPKIVLQPAR
jgi:hypothetical protein